MGKRSRRKRPGRGAALPRDSSTSTANAGDAGARTAVAVAAPTLADQHLAIVEERQRRNQERGDPQAEANRMMQKFRSLLNEDPWNSERLTAFDSFGEIVMHPKNIDYESTQEHIKFLKKIRRSKTEPAFYRALAHEITGQIYLLISGAADVHGEALDHFDKALAIYESADAYEKGLIVSLHGAAICIGDYYEFHVSYITKAVFTLHEGFSFGAWGPTGCELEVAIPAGIQCDCCEESRKGVWEEGLLQCARCKMAYYCSVDCQQKAWKEQGHRLVCRKKGEFKVGDVAVVTESVGGIDSGQRVELIAPVLDDVGTNDGSQSHWLVKEKEGDEQVEVAVKSLKQVRSVLWRQMTREDLAEIVQMIRERDRNKADEEDVPLPELLSNNDCKEELDSDDDENEE